MDTNNNRSTPFAPGEGAKASRYGWRDRPTVLAAADFESLLRGMHAEPDYRYSREYETYRQYVKRSANLLFDEINKISIAVFGNELGELRLVFSGQSGGPGTIADYVPETKTITVYDSPLFQMYLNMQRHNHAGEPDIMLQQVLGHELGHALTFEAYLQPENRPSKVLGDVGRLRQLAESSAELIGIYTSRKINNLPIDNRTIAISMIRAIAEGSARDAIAIDINIEDVRKAHKKLGYNPKLVRMFANIVAAVDSESLTMGTQYNGPQLALGKALLEAKNISIPDFLLRLFQDPQSMPSIRELLSAKDFTGEMVKRYVEKKSDQIRIINEEYERQQAASAKGGASVAQPPKEDPAFAIIMRTEYRSAMEVALRLSQDSHKLAAMANAVLVKYGEQPVALDAEEFKRELRALTAREEEQY